MNQTYNPNAYDFYVNLFETAIQTTLNDMGIELDNIPNETMSITELMKDADIHWCLHNRIEFQKALDSHIIRNNTLRYLSKFDLYDIFDLRTNISLKDAFANVCDTLNQFISYTK